MSAPWRRILLLVCVLLGTDTLVWVQVQHVLSRRLDRLAAAASQAGWRLEAGLPVRGGWPWAATLTLPAVHLRGGIGWSSERVVASLSPLHPGRVAVFAHGVQTITFGAPGSGQGLARSLRLWGPRIALHVPAWSDDPRAATFDAASLHVAPPGAGPGDVLTVAGLRGTVRWTAQARALTLELDSLFLPRRWDPGLGPVIPHVALEASLAGWPGRLLLRQADLRWRDSRLTVSGAATFGAGGLRPDGAFSLRVVGATALLADAVASGRLTAGSASAIRAVLGLVAAGAPRGQDVDAPGLPPIELPLTLREGLLSLGQIPLLQIP